MDKRYQVFVSSTYEDLRAERQEVMQALLELDCIPSGMELFPAANQDQWSLIQRVIGECDYYIVISAGRYGSIGPTGQSYTEMEYRYAISINKPTIAFLHNDPLLISAANTEATDDGKTKLGAFRDLLKTKICKLWDSPADLGSKVSRSLIQLIKHSPAPGWIRTDQVTDTLAAPEILRLRNKIEELEGRLEEARAAAPPGAERLAQGEATYLVDFTFDADDKAGEEYVFSRSFEIEWDEIFYDVGPLMIDETKDHQLRSGLNASIKNRSRPTRRADQTLEGSSNARNFRIADHDFQTIKIQFIALGLIAKSSKNRSLRDTGTYWSLTPYGDQRLTTLRAIPAVEVSQDDKTLDIANEDE